MNFNNAIFDARSWTDIIWGKFGGLADRRIAFGTSGWEDIVMHKLVFGVVT